MEYVLETNALCKSYKNYHALNHLTMHIPKGAVYGFIGKNGAGKTTLIRLVCGLQQPTSGDYSLFGIPASSPEITKMRRRVRAIVETPSLYLGMTAAENLKQQYLLLGLPSFQGLKELLCLVGLENTGKKKVKSFSLGMRARLGIASALVGNPDLLILDEPINGLDPQGIIEIRELIMKLNQEQHITILISSHILDELSRLSTHYGFIDNGQLLKELTAQELEAACRKCIRVQVSNTAVLARVLDSMHLPYQILSSDTANIYGQVSISELVLSLHQQHCDLLSLQEHDESLESYYLNLIGGINHE